MFMEPVIKKAGIKKEKENREYRENDRKNTMDKR